MRRTIYIYLLCITVLLFAACRGPEDRSASLSTENMIVIGAAQMPKSLNFFVDYNTFSIEVGQLLYESLCERNAETWELEGRLAKSWTISPDKLTYTFKLNPDAKWEDGTPVTSDDVIFTYNTVMNPQNLTSLFRLDYEASFVKVYAPDKETVVFKAKNRRWSNFNTAYSFTVLPKHEFEHGDFNKDFNIALPPGSGPYIIEDVQPERFIVLKRRDDYWCKDLPQKKGMYNFARIKYKFILDDEIRLEALKKGDIDLAFPPSAKKWVEWTQENPPYQVKQHWILAKKVYNERPMGYSGFHMNMRRDKFKDVRVRKALAYLLNVKLINEKLMYNQYLPLYSYFPDFFNNDPDLPHFNYNPEKARALLAQAGWDRVDSDGVLINGRGERFEIEFPYSSASLEKHLTIYKEDCAKVGIRINLDLLSAAAYTKKVFEDHDFDMVWLAWGRGGRFPSVEDGWRSDRADAVNTNNIVGYKNPELDKLLDLYLKEYTVEKRIQILKKIDLILTNDVPTVLLWYAPYVRFFYWNKFTMPDKVLKKYADTYSEDSYLTNWSINREKLQALMQAVNGNKALPAEDVDIYYDEALKERYAALSD